jgi:hypothetical protein
MPSKPQSGSHYFSRNTIALGMILLGLCVIQSKLGFLEGWIESSTSLLKFHANSASLDNHVHSMPESTEAAKFDQMRQEYEAQCPVQKYQTRIFSTDPLIIYIEDYLSYEETKYLLRLA